jgi:alpha-D-xyloside xylohydrolase
VYTDFVELKAGKEYSFAVETENYSSGALRVQLYWKTPELFAKEQLQEKKAQTRNVYLPQGAQWYDFWTGSRVAGGKTITADAPIDIIPLYIKAGSIIPIGPFVQYAAEKQNEPLELRIYPGADGQFTLYEDENDSYNYEKGIYSTIAFSWNDAARQLIINKRQGSFPGMLDSRTFHIILVGQNHGTAIESTTLPDKIIQYHGAEQRIQF